VQGEASKSRGPAKGKRTTAGARNEAAFQELHALRNDKSRVEENLLVHLAQRKPLRPNSPSLEYDLKDITNAPNKEKLLELLQPGSSYVGRLAVDTVLFGLSNIVCEATLPDLHSCLHGFLFTDLLGINSDPIRHLLAKAWPLRCWSRKFGDVTAKYIQKHPRVEAFMNHIVLCSLLGNYDYIYPTKPEAMPVLAETRKALYRAFTTNETELRQKILKQTPRVYMYALQQYICMLVRQNPMMERHVAHAFQFADFEQLITKTNQKLRMYIVAHLEGRATFDEAKTKILQEAKETIAPILNTSYQKPRPMFLDWLSEIRSAVKASSASWTKPNYKLAVVKRADYVKPSTLLSSEHKKSTTTKKKQAEHDDEEEETPQNIEKKADRSVQDGKSQEMPLEDAPALLALRGEANDKKGLQSLAMAVVINQEKGNYSEADSSSSSSKDAVPVQITSMHITTDHAEKLQQLLQRMHPTTTTADTVLENFLQCLPAFGCPYAAVAAIRVMWNDKTHYNHAKTKWIEKMKAFHARFPYAYCLLQALRRMWARQKEVQIFTLPGDFARSQTQCIQRRFNLCDNAGVPHEAHFFSLCGVCLRINSLAQSHKSSYKQDYTEGKRNIIHDLDTGLSYCARKDVYAHKTCDDQPLSHIMLVGRTVLLLRRFYMFCCQPDCQGRAMQFDADHVLFNDAGVACTTCTRRIMKQQHAEYRQRFVHLQDSEKKCMLCWKSISASKGGGSSSKTDEKKTAAPEEPKKEEKKAAKEEKKAVKEGEKSEKRAYYLYGLGKYICDRHPSDLLHRIDRAVVAQLSDSQKTQAFLHQDAANAVQKIVESEYKTLKVELTNSSASFQYSKRDKVLLRALKTSNVAMRLGHST
jgi:hypothetical protein